jgi:hypothetical protein
MSIKPILFNGPMVRAILDGKKTQTRRILKQQNAAKWWQKDTPDGGMHWFCDASHNFGESQIANPDYTNSDILYVREAWRMPSNWDCRSPLQTVKSCLECGYKSPWAPIAWEADGGRENWGAWREQEPGRLRPSMHLPKAYARIWLQVTGVRVERLQDISGDDTKAEGLSCISKDGDTYKFGIPDRDGHPGTDNDGWPWAQWDQDPRKAFAKLWDSVATPETDWVANPWVIAIEFEWTTKPERGA